MGAWSRLIQLALCFVLWIPYKCVGEGLVRVRVHLREGGALTGEVEWRSASLRGRPSVEWIRGGERLASPPGVGGELLEESLYPSGFSPSSMEVWAPGSRTGAGLSVNVPHDGGERAAAEFSLQVPERYGSFGRWRGQSTLGGGWFPWVLREGATLPEALPMEVELVAPASERALLGGQWMRQVGSLPSGEVILRGRVEAAPFVSLTISADLEERRAPGVRVISRRMAPSQWRLLSAALTQARFDARREGLADDQELVVVLAPLRRFLSAASWQVLYLSDRVFTTWPPSLHAPAVRVAALRQQVRWRLGRLLHVPREDVGWLSDGVAWMLDRDHQARRARADLSVERVVRPLGFLPAFDQMLYAPRLAFAEELRGSPFLMDPTLEDPERLGRQLPPGRVILLKIADRYGPRATLAACRALLRGGDFYDALAEHARAAPEGTLPAPVDGREVRGFVAGWLGPPPPANLSLERVGLHDGALHAQVRRQVRGAAPEEVVVLAIGPHREELLFPAAQPDEGGEVEQVQLASAPLRLGAVRLDPEFHALETDGKGLVLRGDNRWPPEWKLLFGAAWDSLSLSDGRADFVAQWVVVPRYDRRWRMDWNVYADERAALGSGVEAWRYFGAARDAVWRRQRVGAWATSARWRPTEGGTSAQASSVGVGWRYDSRGDLFDPDQGGRLALSASRGWVQPLPIGEPIPWGAVTASTAGVLSPTGAVTIAGWGRVDVGLGLPEWGWWPLGGDGAVRGLDPANNRGDGRVAAGGELRFTAWRDGQLYVPLYRLRALQLVTFVEGGGVHRPETVVVGSGAGVGVRVFAEALGVQPGLFGIDVAWPTWPAMDLAAPRAYVRFTQAF